MNYPYDIEQQVWKYTLEFDDYTELSMPTGAKILCAKILHDKVRLWVLVTPETGDAERITRVFRMAATGQPMILKRSDYYCLQNEPKYIDTVIWADGDYVYHIFEVLNYVKD